MAFDFDRMTFAAGPTIAVAAWLVAADLEARGLKLVADGEHLVVGPRELLTDSDVVEIRRWRADLIALAGYQATAPAWLL